MTGTQRVGSCSQCGVCCKEMDPFTPNSKGQPCSRLEYRDGLYYCLDYGVEGTFWGRFCKDYPKTEKALEKYAPAQEACSYQFIPVVEVY